MPVWQVPLESIIGKPEKSLEALSLFLTGLIITVVMEGIGEGLILVTQIQEEQFEILQRLKIVQPGA